MRALALRSSGGGRRLPHSKGNLFQRSQYDVTNELIRAMDCLPLTMMRMLDQVELETGMIGTVLLGGPEPKEGGKILIMQYVLHFVDILDAY